MGRGGFGGPTLRRFDYLGAANGKLDDRPVSIRMCLIGLLLRNGWMYDSGKLVPPLPAAIANDSDWRSGHMVFLLDRGGDHASHIDWNGGHRCGGDVRWIRVRFTFCNSGLCAYGASNARPAACDAYRSAGDRGSNARVKLVGHSQDALASLAAQAFVQRCRSRRDSELRNRAHRSRLFWTSHVWRVLRPRRGPPARRWSRKTSIEKLRYRTKEPV
jgi:hypothetical protein